LQEETNLVESEIVTERLLQEFEHLNLVWLSIDKYGETKNSKGEWIKVYKNKDEGENQTKFVFAFLQNTLSKFPVEDLYTRNPRIPMTNLSKKELFWKLYEYRQTQEQNLQNFQLLWENLTNPNSPLKQRLDSFLEKIKSTKNLKELSELYQSPQGQEFEIYSFQSLKSRRFPQEIYDLVIQNNFEGFKKAITSKRFETDITDKKDPAYYGYIQEQKISEEEKNAEITFSKNPTKGWSIIV